ncbi:hypothetical protein [Halomonas organivorans]|uniref:Uncharacterized protein n=1 Tax=Halomonas organivorans TaxID=257772 RepID=A0A7W5C120_9GAMM|nr:hypothetical protein [Halomonas organivorans]MBB3142799.1 hypothetical protein [Halomonas organivorans]
MSIKRILQAIGGERLDLCSQSELLEIIELADIAHDLGGGHYDVLRCCHSEGPVRDGDVPSKAHRDDLLEVGAIAKVVVRGEDGFNACTYRGRELMKAMEALPPVAPGRD